MADDGPVHFPPGHFYSPYPDLADIRQRAADLFANDRPLPDVVIDEHDQTIFLERCAAMYATIPFAATSVPGLRYRYDNPAYAFSDGLILHCMLRLKLPRRLVEVGSGWSSCVILDTNDRFLDGAMDITFIEPHPELLRELTETQGIGNARIVTQRLQDVPLDVFRALGAGDVLFIDSTHVSKAGSDVNYLFFDILPRLATGVLIHLHDIFFPFEYPPDWIFAGRAWSEAYLLHAFLLNNEAYRIRYWQHYMFIRHQPFFSTYLPACLSNGGGNFWMEKTGAGAD